MPTPSKNSLLTGMIKVVRDHVGGQLTQVPASGGGSTPLIVRDVQGYSIKDTPFATVAVSSSGPLFKHDPTESCVVGNRVELRQERFYECDITFLSSPEKDPSGLDLCNELRLLCKSQMRRIQMDTDLGGEFQGYSSVNRSVVYLADSFVESYTVKARVHHKVILEDDQSSVIETVNIANNLLQPSDTTNIDLGQAEVVSAFQGSLSQQFETISQNLNTWDAAYTYNGDTLEYVTYTNQGKSVVKDLVYNGSGLLTSIVLSGDTPSNIDLTKNFSYDMNEKLIGVSYD